MIQKTIRNYPTQSRCIVTDIKKSTGNKKKYGKKVRKKSTWKKKEKNVKLFTGNPVSHKRIYSSGVTSGIPIGHAQ